MQLKLYDLKNFGIEDNDVCDNIHYLDKHL